jgi:replicative DNA helicase Mcm
LTSSSDIDSNVTETASTVIESTSAISDKLHNFLTNYKDKQGNYFYFDKISELVSREKNKSLIIKYEDLSDEIIPYFFSNDIAGEDVEDNIELLSQTVREIYSELYPDNPDAYKVNAKLSIDDPLLVTKMKHINVDLLSRLVVFNCTILSKTEPKAAFRKKIFTCDSCGEQYEKKINACIIDDCGSKSISLSIQDSIKQDCEYLEVQEMQEDIKSSRSFPVQKTVKVYGDLVGRHNPGSNIRVIGFIKLQSISGQAINARQIDDLSDDLLFDIVIEAHNLENIKTSHESILEDPMKILSTDDINAILKLRKKYNDLQLMEVLVNSFAPHIFGHKRIKEAIILQLIGSISGMQREYIHMLLVGDPGTAKSKLLDAALKMAIHGAKAVGSGSSGVGLTAGVIPDKRGVNKVGIGAAVLADLGLCAVDEFSNISEKNQSYLLESMEHGKFTMTKIVSATFNTRTTFLMAMNPDGGKYNQFNSLKDNISLTDQLLSRFDMIFIVLDVVDKKKDEKLSDHIFSLYDPYVGNSTSLTDGTTADPIKKISEDLLYKYLVYAKINNTDNIQLTKEAKKRFKEFYNEIRQGSSHDVTATPRQLEGMLRLGFARSRALLKNELDEDVAIETIKLLSDAYESVGLRTGGAGGLNQTAIYSKNLHDIKSKELVFTMVMTRLTNDNQQEVDQDTVILELVNAAGWLYSDAKEFFEKMRRANKLRNPTDEHHYLLDV